jgi:hypothetical protein
VVALEEGVVGYLLSVLRVQRGIVGIALGDAALGMLVLGHGGVRVGAALERWPLAAGRRLRRQRLAARRLHRLDAARLLGALRGRSVDGPPASCRGHGRGRGGGGTGVRVTSGRGTATSFAAGRRWQSWQRACRGRELGTGTQQLQCLSRGDTSIHRRRGASQGALGREGQLRNVHMASAKSPRLACAAARREIRAGPPVQTLQAS